MSELIPDRLAQKWIDAAREALIREGISGVKVDRLAGRLGVTRGGFYHSFRDRDDLLARLLHDWERRCQLLPLEPPGKTPADAVRWLDQLNDRMIGEKVYDRDFDMAVREWGRSEPRAAWAMDRADAQRVDGLVAFFRALGYEEAEAQVRARIFYYHQVGYYAIGIRQTAAERRRDSKLYIDSLCGSERLAAARAQLQEDVPSASRTRRAAAR